MSGEIIRKVKTSISSKKGWLSGSIEYEVYSDTISGAENTDANTILGLSGIPQWGEVIGATRAKGYIQSVQASRNGGDVINGKYRWSVVASVGSDGGSKNNDQRQLDQFAISRSVEEIEIYRGVDTEGNMNCNSAGEFFEEGLAMKIPIITWTFSGTLTTNPESWNAFLKHTNHATMWGTFYTDELLFDSLTYSHAVGSGEWDTQIVIKYNPLKWRELRADVGYYYRDPDTGALVRILNEDGSPKESPTPLLPNGAVNTTGIMNFKTFYPYETFNMAALGLANPLFCN